MFQALFGPLDESLLRAELFCKAVRGTLCRQQAVASQTDTELLNLVHSKATCYSHYLDLLPVLKVDPGGHISGQLDKPLLPRCDVQLYRQTLDQ